MKFDIQAFINHPHVLTSRRDGLVIFNYDHACTYERAWDEVTLQARGLILEEATGEVLARCMQKFFNLNEMPATRYENLPDLPFTATEKQDGYLGLHYRWHGEDWIATRGSFESVMAQWGTAWFREHVHSECIDPEWTYHFEIIYNRKIVISYDFEGLVLLTAVHKETGMEMPYNRLVQEAKALGVRVTPLMPEFPTLLDLAEYVRGLPGNKEGCVITFSNGLKVKVKGQEYCRIHKIVSRMTPLAFWEAYDTHTGCIPKDFLVAVPEEFRETSDALVIAIEEPIRKAVEAVREAHDRVLGTLPPGVDDKTFALKAQEMYPRDFGYVMHFRNQKMQKLRFAIHKKNRPTDNKLIGSIPGLDRILHLNDEG